MRMSKNRITHCAKCGKLLKSVRIPMGSTTYGKSHPFICAVCQDKWSYVFEDLVKKRGMKWKQAFEKWIGREWLIFNPSRRDE